MRSRVMGAEYDYDHDHDTSVCTTCECDCGETCEDAVTSPAERTYQSDGNHISGISRILECIHHKRHTSLQAHRRFEECNVYSDQEDEKHYDDTGCGY